MTMRVDSVAALLLAISLIGVVMGSGGLAVLATVDAGRDAQTDPLASPVASLATATLGMVTVVAITAARLYWRKSRRAFASGMALVAGFGLAVTIGEGLSRSLVPSWPARALHGVSPAQWAAATADASRPAQEHTRETPPSTVQLNSWGQRDRERSLLPPAGIRRIAFIGDSFLEEGAAVPVSIETERAIGRSDVEVLNLGVSATGPDEYYDRLRGVALPLGISHCCLFIFAGNDFVSPERTLASFGGIAAVEPRPSLLTTLGCAGWNHLLTNNRRPVIEAWISGTPLSRDEQSRHRILRQATDQQIRQMLLYANGLDQASQSRLAARLARDDIGGVFEMLRDPDEGRYRSYYLEAALAAASQPDWTWEPNSEEVAWEWTQRAARLCRRRNIALTIVVIPEAFQVDDRMREQWLPLADMRRCTAPCRDAAQSFIRRARADALDVVDLGEALQGTRGTYLNLDGHWSAAGVKLVAGVLANHLLATVPPSPEAVQE